MTSARHSHAVCDAPRDLRALGKREDVSCRQAVQAREADLALDAGLVISTPTKD